MKVLLVNTSEEENGTLMNALKMCSSFLSEKNIDSEIIDVKNVHPCTGCGKCLRRRKCLFDGIVNEIASRSEEFDGMIVSSEVLYGQLSKVTIDFMNCLFRSANEKFVGKVGAVLLHAHKGYPMEAYNKLNSYYSSSCMPVMTGRYYNTIHDLDEKDTIEIQRLVENMSWLLNCIAVGKQEGIFNPDSVEKLDEFMKGR